MSNDKMRAEFEAWAESQCLSLTRINWIDGTVSDYAYTATLHAWRIWQAAYDAGRKAADEQIEELQLILREVLENDSYEEELHNNSNFDDELKQRIEAAIRYKPEGER